MQQVEVSRRVRTVFEELLAATSTWAAPSEVIFGSKVTRSTPGVFSTRLLNRGDQVTINLSFNTLASRST